MTSERERLVNQLDKIKTQCNDEGSFYPACMGCVADFILADRRRVIEEIEKPLKKYDAHAGYEHGPFKDCECPSHHAHSEHGKNGCPVCMTKWVKEALAKCEEMKGDGK